MIEKPKKYHFTKQIKEQALQLGFLNCGISQSQELAGEKERLKTWLSQNRNGEMAYMNNHFEKRTDPVLLFEGTKSIISLNYNYYSNKYFEEKDGFKISKYAYGSDYHHVIKSKLKILTEFILQIIPEAKCRSFVDSAPVMDKVWAQKAGLGWMGKNTNIISKKHGSFFFIAEILIDQELEYDEPVEDYCGKCTQCIDACPTNAIYDEYKLDGSKCISYLTIELKEEIPQNFKGKYNNWIFGCDICQDVCPWNSKSVIHNEPEFEPHPDLLKLTKTDWENLSLEQFQKIFKKSAVKRTKYEGLKRNIKFLNKT